MPELHRVVIVGVGLLGGSIGLALRRRGLARQVIGTGRRAQTLSEAKALGAIDDFICDLETACTAADLVVVCTPVQSIAPFTHKIQLCALASDCLVTDVGSTKANICRDLPDSAHRSFCGSHPMAGSQLSGVRFASADLFEDRLTIVTPTPQTPVELSRRTEQFWQSLGCRTVQMSPERHDQAMAGISHLPHLIAAALAAQTDDSLLPLAGPGWADTTRVAAGDVELWRQIIVENQQPVLQAMRDFSGSLQPWIAALERGDSALLTQLLDQGK